MHVLLETSLHTVAAARRIRSFAESGAFTRRRITKAPTTSPTVTLYHITGAAGADVWALNTNVSEPP